MWLFTEHGFYSIVKKAKGEWHVRARLRADLLRLVPLLPGSPVVQKSYPGSDYPWRILINARQKASLFQHLSKIEYGNFKGRVAEDPEQRSRLPVYHEVWHLMAGVPKSATE